LSAPSERSELLATIDIGTNSVLLQIARADARGGIVVVDDRATITRLGRGVDRTQQLDDAAIARTLEVLAGYAAAARDAGARIIAVGTSALRDAHNARAFLDPAQALLGTAIEVISGAREAKLTFLGATQGLHFEHAERCVVDVGGGSTEIVLGRGDAVIASVSLNIGAVRLTERHALGSPATPAQLAAITDDVCRALDASPVQPRTPLVAIAGSATTLAAIALKVAPYDPIRIHGARLNTKVVEALTARLASMSIAERGTLPGLPTGRADVIVAGALVLLELARRASASEFTVSNGGVRLGLAVQELRQKPVDGRRSSE
jgi:exopolyphosphatase/guanosine-5'-triphosphate,3'-diphosphate pyrophosphatase